ncbi:MAG: hypothetical protein Q8Q62_12990, partial [Mesorhizobium sp.]|nr:hypothetical protein [Mesorhizobium sp.]
AEAKAAPVRLAFGDGDDAVTIDIRSAEASVTGSGATPVVDAALDLAQLITPQVKLTDVGLDVSSTAFDVRTRTGPVDAQLSAGTVSSNIAGLAPYLVGQFAAAIKADIGAETIAITRSSIEGEALSATASGTLIRTDGSADIDFTGDVTTAALPGAARGILGERLAIAGTFLRKADGAVDFSVLDITSGKLAASGSAGLAGGVVRADLSGALADLSGLADGVSGAATFGLTANGPVVGPTLTLKLNSDRIESGGRAITGLALTATGSSNADAPAADISLTGMVEGQALKGSAKLATRDGRREVSGLSLTLGENRISGDLVLDEAFLPVGSVDFTLPDLAPLAALALQQASGAASGRIVFETAADGPSATIDATVQSFRRGDISGQTIGIEASVANYVAQPAVSGRIRAASVTAGATAISDIDVRLTRDGAWTGFDGGATAAGIPAKAKGRAKFENGTATVELDAGSATVRGIAATIAKRSTIVNANGVTRLDAVTLAIGGGSAVVSGTVGATLALDATLSGIPASLADSFAPGLGATGTVAGTVRISGQASAPAVAYDLTLSGAQTGQTRSAGFGGLQIASTGTFANGTLNFDATVGDGSGITMRGGGSVAPGGAINVQFNGNVPFGFLTSRLAAQGLSLSGAADVAITVRGSTSAPDIGGTVRASGARMIDARSGIAIGDINADIALGGGVATLRAFTGSISTGGKISASGTIGIDGATGFPADLSVK